MSIRTVRLDKETENVLADVLHKSNFSISSAMKAGLCVLQETLTQKKRILAFEIYKQLDLGPGDKKIPSSTNTRQAVLNTLKRKHKL